MRRITDKNITTNKQNTAAIASATASAASTVTHSTMPEEEDEVWPLKSDRTLKVRWATTIENLIDQKKNPVGQGDPIKWQLMQISLLHLSEDGVTSKQVGEMFTILDRMVEEAAIHPEFRLEISYLHAVLKAWKDAVRAQNTDLLPSQVLAKLDEYKTRVPSLLSPNIATYTMILNGAAYSPMPQERIQFSEMLLERLIKESEENPKVKPTLVTFGTVVNAYAQSGNIAGVEKAEELCSRLEEISQDNNWKDVRPNYIILSAVIHGWAKAGYPYRANLVLQKMYEEYVNSGNEDVKPNTYAFNSVLMALAKAKEPNSLELAKSLFEKMIELSESGNLDVYPDIISYDSILACHARIQPSSEKNVKDTEAWFSQIVSMGERNPKLMPTVNSCISLVKTIRESSVADKAERIQKVLNFMETHRLKKTVYVLDSLEMAKKQSRRKS